MHDKDLVSCLCVTDSRGPLLKNAVNCFFAQTHSKKELIIVYNPRDKETESYISTLNDSVKAVPAPSGLSLGELRNIALDAASGNYVCVWDDDDWHHPERIARQLNAAKLHHKRGSILVSLLMYDCINNQSYLSHRRPWDGTLLIKKDALISENIRYPSKNLSEDTAFTAQLLIRNYLWPINDPCLYVYQFTGGNSWSLEHFQRNFSLGIQLSTIHTEMLKTAITESENCAYTLLESPEFQDGLNFFFDHLRMKGLMPTPISPQKKVTVKKKIHRAIKRLLN